MATTNEKAKKRRDARKTAVLALKELVPKVEQLNRDLGSQMRVHVDILLPGHVGKKPKYNSLFQMLEQNQQYPCQLSLCKNSCRIS